MDIVRKGLSALVLGLSLACAGSSFSVQGAEPKTEEKKLGEDFKKFLSKDMRRGFVSIGRGLGFEFDIDNLNGNFMKDLKRVGESSKEMDSKYGIELIAARKYLGDLNRNGKIDGKEAEIPSDDRFGEDESVVLIAGNFKPQYGGKKFEFRISDADSGKIVDRTETAIGLDSSFVFTYSPSKLGKGVYFAGAYVDGQFCKGRLVKLVKTEDLNKEDPDKEHKEFFGGPLKLNLNRK